MPTCRRLFSEITPLNDEEMQIYLDRNKKAEAQENIEANGGETTMEADESAAKESAKDKANCGTLFSEEEWNRRILEEIWENIPGNELDKTVDDTVIPEENQQSDIPGKILRYCDLRKQIIAENTYGDQGKDYFNASDFEMMPEKMPFENVQDEMENTDCNPFCVIDCRKDGVAEPGKTNFISERQKKRMEKAVRTASMADTIILDACLQTKYLAFYEECLCRCKTLEINSQKIFNDMGKPELREFYASVFCDVETVILGDAISKIPDDVFSGYERLIRIEKGKNVLSIGDRAMYECPNLQFIDCPKVRSVGKDAFVGCEGFKYGGFSAKVIKKYKDGFKSKMKVEVDSFRLPTVGEQDVSDETIRGIIGEFLPKSVAEHGEDSVKITEHNFVITDLQTSSLRKQHQRERTHFAGAQQRKPGNIRTPKGTGGKGRKGFMF